MLPHRREPSKMIPELLAISALRVAGAGCTDTTACSLAGACVSGACVCDQGFKGDDCSVLDLKVRTGGMIWSGLPRIRYSQHPEAAAGGGGLEIFIDKASRLIAGVGEH